MTTTTSPTDETLAELTKRFANDEVELALGGGLKAIARQHEKGRLTARERIELLIDPGSTFHEIGLWAAWSMYEEWGGARGAGVACGVGRVHGRAQMIIANDATVKAGAFFPTTVKKVLRCQRIAMQNRLPLIYLVDSAGAFLPLQEEIFPDEDDFGRIFRNNAVISASGLGQISAIMGNCVAGGGYLPVLCDKLLMTDGSGLYLAGPALVRSAIGQRVSSEELGGAAMHAQVSGTIDYRDATDEACLQRLRKLVADLPPEAEHPAPPFSRHPGRPAARPGTDLYDVVHPNPRNEYDVKDVIDCIVDADSFEEYKAEYGKTLVCGTGRIDGFPVGIIANQHKQQKPAEGPLQYGGVIYVDSANKAARFIMNCNQDWLPLVFLQDVNGFMVGRDSEREGIIKSGAKLVNAISNSRVPKLTVLTGGSFGAGNYALCGKAFDPRLVFAWPNSRCAVMGGDQATKTLLDISIRSLERQGHQVDADELATMRNEIKASYDRHMDVRYGASRLWIDRIIDPARTREELTWALESVTRHCPDVPFQLGVFQV